MTEPNAPVYTAITFAPVQSFIEKSRKLRDLHGSSYVLSFLAQAVCIAAERAGCSVVSPALPNIIQGMPNQIIIRGKFSKVDAQRSFDTAWQCVTETCRQWVETRVNENWNYYWKRDWRLWAKYTWEFFWVQGEPTESITEVRQRLNGHKRLRNWTAINWMGESSTLSGTDAIAWAELGKIADPRQYDYQATKIGVERFYQQLSETLGEAFYTSITGRTIPEEGWDEQTQARIKEYGEAFIDPDEELSIPELVKRLITHRTVVKEIVNHLLQELQKQYDEPLSLGARKQLKELVVQVKRDLNPKTFRDLNRLEQQSWTGWFMGDGDGASDYLKRLGQSSDPKVSKAELIEREDAGTTVFSRLMRQWGQEFKAQQWDQQRQINISKYLPNGHGRLIYAGGDDFMGVIYRPDRQLQPEICVDWFCSFKSKIWDEIDFRPVLKNQIALTRISEPKPISPSIGFVWVAPNVPQREVLQHCREAEKSAKTSGKDRIAFRVLFNGGNYLEWACPWWLLEEGFLRNYADRNGGQNWAHIYSDVAVLQSRHAFEGEQIEVALGIVEVYFGLCFRALLEDENYRWNRDDDDRNRLFTGILGDANRFQNSKQICQAINDWVINLARVGFYLLDREYTAE